MVLGPWSTAAATLAPTSRAPVPLSSTSTPSTRPPLMRPEVSGALAAARSAAPVMGAVGRCEAALCRAATRRRCGGSDEPPGKSPARPPCVPVGTFPAPQWPALMVPRSGTCPYDNRARVPTSAPAAPATLRCTRSAPAPIVGVSLPAAAIHAATFFAKHPTHVCPPRSAVFRPLPTSSPWGLAPACGTSS